PRAARAPRRHPRPRPPPPVEHLPHRPHRHLHRRRHPVHRRARQPARPAQPRRRRRARLPGGRMSRRASPTAVGAFVIAAVVLAVAGLVLVGSGRLFHRTYPFVVYFRGSVPGLSPGAPAKFRGVEVGRVRDVSVEVSKPLANAPEIRIPVVVALDPDKVGIPGSTTLGDRERMMQLVDAGLRAQLAVGSFVTAMRYVSLDIMPGTPKDLVSDPNVPYPEIPTLPTDLEHAEKQVGDVLARLSRVDIESLFKSAQKTLDGVERLMTTPDVTETLRSVQRSAKSFEEAMRNLNAAAVTLRHLADQVGPDVVATGKNVR